MRCVAACMCECVMNEYRPDPSFAVTQVGPLEPKLGSWLDARGLQALGV